MSARRWEDLDSAPVPTSERITERRDLTAYRAWVAQAFAATAPMRPRVSSSGLFHALRVRP